MFHTYQYSFIDMNQALRANIQMKDYIHWSLENEHGNVGFDATHRRDIPLSRFGIQLKTARGMARIDPIIKHVIENADGNVAMARLRLDVINRLSDLDLIEAQMGTPPPDVNALLDAAFGATQHHCVPLPQRELALKVLAILSFFPHHDQTGPGVKYETLSLILQQSDSPRNGCSPVVYTQEQILIATGGLAFFLIPEGMPLLVYNSALHTYLREESSQPAPVAKMLKALEEVLSPFKELVGDD